VATGKAESPMRSMLAESEGNTYHAFDSLPEAQRDPEGVVILEGDEGGQIYVVVRAMDVACSEEILRQLLVDIDNHEWPGNYPDMARLCFEKHPVGAGIAGGMGGGLVSAKLWVHPRLEPFASAIAEVIYGQRERLDV